MNRVTTDTRPLSSVSGVDMKSFANPVKTPAPSPYTLRPEALKQLTENALSQVPVPAKSSGSQENLHPEYWVTTLQNLATGIKQNLAEELDSFHAVVIANKVDPDLAKSWVVNFAECGGFVSLVTLLKAHADNPKGSKEILRCFGLLLNNDNDTGRLATTPGLLDICLACFKKGDDEVRVLVAQLMTVICCMAPQGHSLVLDSLAYAAGIKTASAVRFNILIAQLKASPNVELKYSIMALLNGLLNFPELSLDQRVSLRGQLNELGMQSVLVELRKHASRGLAAKEDGCVVLLQHLDRYELDLTSDLRASQVDELDLSDPETVFNFLLNRTQEDGLTSQLLAMMHSLLTIPTHKAKGADLWKNVQFIVHEAAHSKQVSISELRDMLSKKESTDTRESESRVQVLEAENARLKEQLSAASTNKGGVGNAPVRKPPPPPELPPPAPIMASVVPPPPAPALIGLSAPAGELATPEFLAQYGKLLPPAGNSAVPLKPFHWSKIPPSKIPSTCWGTILTAKQLPCISSSELSKVEQLFFVKADKRSGADRRSSNSGLSGLAGAGVSGGVKESGKREAVKLIDPKRAYAIDIGLAHFRMSHLAIREAIVGMDFFQLDRERLSQLTPIIPTSHEIQAVVSHVNDGGDPSLLDNAGQFIYTLSDVIGTPDLHTRLALFNFKQQFGEIIGGVEQNLSLVESACSSLRNSTNLLALLKIVLMVGNFLNGSSNKGNAFGFKLSSLAQLSAIKSADNKRTLLQHIVELVNEKFPSVGAKLVTDLKAIPQAAKIESGCVEQEVVRIAEYIEKLRKALETIASVDAKLRRGDNFEDVMSLFYDVAHTKCQNLQKRLQQTLVMADSVTVFFGEEKGSMKWEHLFGKFDQFLNAYSHAQATLLKQQEVEEKRRRKDEAGAGRHERKESRGQSTEKKKILDDLVNGVLTAIQTDAVHHHKDGKQLRSLIEAQGKHAVSRPPSTVQGGMPRGTSSAPAPRPVVPSASAPPSRPHPVSMAPAPSSVPRSAPSFPSGPVAQARISNNLNNPSSSAAPSAGRTGSICRVCKCASFRPHPFNNDKCGECSHMH